ncbi:hypothetical protein [Faecalibacillus faecis]|uniref:hypothetical protein n=1 Tax=Faecalibacillus faecis TaxID=1982628 RepID=UPI00386CC3F5
MEQKKDISKDEYLTKIISIAQKMDIKQTEHAFYVLKGMQIRCDDVSHKKVKKDIPKRS